jgi:hypothetical protein
MAVALFNPVAPTGNGSTNVIYAGTLGAAGTPLVTVGNDNIIRIAASGAFTVRFGTTTNLTASGPATATDIYFPAGVYIYDVGHNNNALSIYSFGASNIVTVNAVPRN